MVFGLPVFLLGWIWRNKLTLLVLGGVGIVALPYAPAGLGSAVPGFDAGDTFGAFEPEEGGTASSGGVVNQTPAETAMETSADGSSSGADVPDPRSIEELIHVNINAERSDRGLSNLTFDRHLANIARNHSQDMARDGYFSHEDQQGDNFEDRYAENGYNCRVHASGNMYYGGAENIAYTYFEEQLAGGYFHTSERDVAQGIVRQWMNSDGHRENILREFWNREGIGVAVTETDEGTRIYVTQNFC